MNTPKRCTPHELFLRKYGELYPDLLRLAIADKQVCLGLISRMDNRATFSLAIHVLAEYFPPDNSVSERCRQILEDRMANDDFRATATHYLSCIYKNTKDRIIIDCLLSVICDELNGEGLRVCAYFAFRDVVGASFGLWSRIPKSTRDIDWRLIRKWSQN
jgi:hypothetical protein